MADPSERRILEEFRQRVARGDLDHVSVTFRVPRDVRGMEHATEELRMEGTVHAHAETERADAPPAEVDTTLAAEEAETAFREVADVLDDLVLRSEARFLPDSAVGSIKVEVEDEQVDLFFLADEDDREQQDVPLSPEALDAIEDLTRLQHRLLEGEH